MLLGNSSMFIHSSTGTRVITQKLSNPGMVSNNRYLWLNSRDFRYKFMKAGALTFGAMVTPPFVSGVFPYIFPEVVQGMFAPFGTYLVGSWETGVVVHAKNKYLELNRDYHRKSLEESGLQLPNDSAVFNRHDYASGKNQDKLQAYPHFNRTTFLELPHDCTIGQFLDSAMGRSTTFGWFMIVPAMITALAAILVAIYKLRHDAKKATEVKISHIDEPHNDYLRTHWYNELSKNISGLLARASSPVIYVITGIGGSGKTQLANDYAIEEIKHVTLVWKITADTPDSLWEGYCLLAVELGIDTKPLHDHEGLEAWKTRIRLLVNKVLSHRSEWRIIFDNVSDKTEREVKKYFPKNGNGVVLITTQNSRMLDGKPRLDIGGGLDEDEAEKLLLQFSGLEKDANARELATELERLPLNLRIAGAVIQLENENRKDSLEQPTAKFSCEDYIRQLRELSPQQIRQRQQRVLLNLPDDYKITQTMVVNDALQRLTRVSPEALRILECCSYLSPTGIPRELLENFVYISIFSPSFMQKVLVGLNLTNPTHVTSFDISLKCDELMLAIQKLSLLQKTSGKYDIHRCVQQEVRNSRALSVSTTVNVVLSSMLLLLDGVRSSIESNAASRIWKPLLPHIEVLVSNNKALAMADGASLANLLHYAGRLNDISGNILRAKAHYERSLPLKERHYGKEHIEVARTLNNLSNIYGDLGDPHKRREFAQRAFDINVKHYGERHLQTAINMSNLAIACGDLGDYAQQEKLARQALDIVENDKTCGKNHIYAGMILHVLANAYGDLEDYDKQRDAAARALTIHKTHYEDDDSIFVVMVENSLANAYVDLGELGKARALLRHVLSVKGTFYGKNHWHYAMTLNDLARVHIKMGNFVLGIWLLERQVLPVFEQSFGKNSWKFAEPLINLALAYDACDNQEQRNTLLVSALTFSRNTFNDSHPDIIRLQNLLDQPLAVDLLSKSDFMKVAAETPYR
jgi:tetratricopeptide (TPR) repeat protein